MNGSNTNSYRSQAMQQATEALNLDESSYFAFFQNAPVAMAVIDSATMRILAANEMSVKLFGYTHEEFIGKSPAEFTYPGDIVITKENFRQFRSDSTGEAIVEKRYVRKDGSVFWAQSGISILKREGGKDDLLIGTVIDISERKRAEKLIADNELFYRMAGKSARIGAWAIELPENKVIWSDEIRYILEVPNGIQPTLDDAIRFYSPESRDRILTVIERCKKGGVPFDEEYQLVTAAGNMLTVRVLGEAVRDDKGAIVKLQGSFQDISAIKAYDEALHKSHEKMRLCIEHAPIQVAMFDRDMKYLAASERWVEEHDLKRKEIIGRCLHEISPCVPDKWREIHSQALAGAATKEGNGLWIKADGRKTWLRWAVSSWTNRQGEIGGIFISCDDISEFKERDLRLQQLTFVLDNLKEAIFFVGEDGRFLYVNEEVCRVLGHTRDELLNGMGVPDVGPGWTYEGWSEHWRDIQIRKSLTFEASQRTKTGEFIPVEINASYIEFEGEHFTIGLVRDISERRRSEAGQRELFKYMQIAREEERARISREIHDEMGSLLATFRLNLCWLERRIPVSESSQHEMIDAMRQQIDDGMQAVRDLSTEIHPAILDKLGLLAAIEWQAKQFESRSGIICKLSIVGKRIHVDTASSSAIFRVVQEALTNILRHAKATETSIRVKIDNRDLIISIKDNGTGIPPQRLSSPYSHGLTGMRERMRQFDGNMQIISNPETGTLLLLHMPLSRKSRGGQ